MAVPEGATKLGTVGIAYKGVYDELATYKYANAVYYNGSTYIALIDNPAGFPSNDGVNWRYLAQGFMEQEVSALTVIDESGILGEVDAEVNAQEFLSKIAELEQGLEDTKANKADVLDSLEEIVANTEDGRIMGAKAGAELNNNLTWKKLTEWTGAGSLNVDFSLYEEICIIIHVKTSSGGNKGRYSIHIPTVFLNGTSGNLSFKNGCWQGTSDSQDKVMVQVILNSTEQTVFSNSQCAFNNEENLTEYSTWTIMAR